VDFRVTEDQKTLQEGFRSFCEARVPGEALAELEAAGGLDRKLWRELAEMGVFQLRRPEAEGGLGLGMSEAVLIFQELGRRVVPGPLVWSHLAAGRIPGAESGETVVGGLDRIRSSSEPLLVEQLDRIDQLLVLRPEGVVRIDARSIQGRPVGESTDPLTPVHHVEELPEGERLGGVELAERLRLEGAALCCGQLLGIAESCLELACDYAKRREQFGRPVGSFQALKHMMADMFVRQEEARAAAYAAGATLDDPAVGDPARAVSIARLVCERAAHRNARACIQIHGGMGFTWEMLPHYYLKRCWVIETCFGTADEHAECVAAAL